MNWALYHFFKNGNPMMVAAETRSLMLCQILKADVYVRYTAQPSSAHNKKALSSICAILLVASGVASDLDETPVVIHAFLLLQTLMLTNAYAKHAHIVTRRTYCNILRSVKPVWNCVRETTLPSTIKLASSFLKS